MRRRGLRRRCIGRLTPLRKKLVLTWTSNYNTQETLITLTFRKDGGGTRLTLHQEGFGDIGLRDAYNGGSFDKLAAFLAA